jgi:two-component system cell cycle response regulator DivK
VTGIRVPGPFDGVELVRRLRADDRTKDKPVIILTGCAFQTNRDDGDGAGCDAFLSKPCLPATLVSEIRHVLTMRSVAPSRPARTDSHHPSKKKTEVA